MNAKEINSAVDYLYTHGAKFAEAKAHRVYMEEYRKSQKAMLMKQALLEGRSKTSASAEVEAYADPSYLQLLEALKQAVENEERFRWGLISAQARIEVYRTQSANDRAMDRAVQ